jgi:hypothetical protein
MGITSIILVALAAVCNAIMDVLSHHYPRSIFNRFNPKWWNPKTSWMNKYVNWPEDKRKRKMKITLYIPKWKNNGKK